VISSNSIVPLNEVRREVVEEYHVARGMPAEILQWKYYDERFNRGRLRGLVWMREDRVAGFLGVMPTRMRRGSDVRDMIWTCDWSLRDPTESPGMGILLHKRLIQQFDHILVFGGNENTLRLAPRMATLTIPDAGAPHHKILRSGALVQKFAPRLPRLRLDRWPLIGSVPVPGRRRRVGACRCVVYDGVAGSLTEVIDQVPSQTWMPWYDQDYLDWVIGRCPHLQSRSFLAPEGAPRAAGLCWRSSRFPRRWRMAIWKGPDGDEPLRAVLAEAVNGVDRLKGDSISIIVARGEGDLMESLRWAGFFESWRKTPLFVFTQRPASEKIESMQGLSYVDTDLAYLF
jgi:hypothetical protein